MMLICLLPAGAADSKDAFATVDSVMAKYRQAPAIKADVKKTVTQEVMGLTTVSEGQFYFSKGKLRLEITKPEISTLVYDGKYVWVESRLDDSNIQVTKMRTNELKRSNSVLTALFEKKNILRNFDLLNTSGSDGIKKYSFKPKRGKESGEVSRLEISLKGKELRSVSYTDQLENEVRFEFKKLTPGKVSKSKFSYTPPKNAEVTEI